MPINPPKLGASPKYLKTLPPALDLGKDVCQCRAWSQVLPMELGYFNEIWATFCGGGPDKYFHKKQSVRFIQNSLNLIKKKNEQGWLYKS